MQLLNLCPATLNKMILKKEKRQAQKRTLSGEEAFFLVLCRYKVGLLEEDLAARFRISQSLVSQIVTWTKFRYYWFNELDIFPDRQIIESRKPACLKNKYKGTTVIIDATEMYIEKPSNPETQQLTFSAYKNTNTLKALVGITPSGSVCFISDLYGGCISDKEITSNLVLLTNYSKEMRSWQIVGSTFKKC